MKADDWSSFIFKVLINTKNGQHTMDLMVFVNQTEKETRKSQNFVMRKFAFKRGVVFDVISSNPKGS